MSVRVSRCYNIVRSCDNRKALKNIPVGTYSKIIICIENDNKNYW